MVRSLELLAAGLVISGAFVVACKTDPGKPANITSVGAPPSYCESLAPYLEKAGSEGPLKVELRCFDMPGITDLGFYGPPDAPTSFDLDECLTAEEANAVKRETSPFTFSYSYKARKQFSADGSLDLLFLGQWAPKLVGGGGHDEMANLEIRFENVRFRRITNLPLKLSQSTDPDAQGCIDRLRSEVTVFAPTVLVGRMVVTIASVSASKLGGELSVTPLLSFKVTSRDDEGGTLTLESEGDVVIGASILPSKPILGDIDTVLQRFYPDRDGDGFGSGQIVFVKHEGYGLATSDGDCDDNNPNVFPGQTAFFASPRANGSFDYDCDGKETPRDTQSERGCHRVGNSPAGNCVAHTGWAGGVPNCGQAGAWLDDCDTVSSFNPFKPKIAECSKREESQRRQHCR